jgi:hypothetical protein
MTATDASLHTALTGTQGAHKRGLFACCSRLVCVILSGVAVVLGVTGGLIGVYVVGPAMSQHITDNVIYVMNNNTVRLDSVPIGSNTGWGTLWSNMTLTVNKPAVLLAKLKPYRVSLSSYGIEFGTFEFPGLDNLKNGLNQVVWVTNITITNASQAMIFATSQWIGIDQQMEVKGACHIEAFGFLHFYPKQNVTVMCTNLLPDWVMPDGVSSNCSEPITTKAKKSGLVAKLRKYFLA